MTVQITQEYDQILNQTRKTACINNAKCDKDKLQFKNPVKYLSKVVTADSIYLVEDKVGARINEMSLHFWIYIVFCPITFEK